jgi:hypothetical protein
MIIPNWMDSHKIHVPNHQPVLDSPEKNLAQFMGDDDPL